MIRINQLENSFFKGLLTTNQVLSKDSVDSVNSLYKVPLGKRDTKQFANMRHKGTRERGGDKKNESKSTFLYSLVSAILDCLFYYHKFNLYDKFLHVFLLRKRSPQRA